jgi:hypothetical protein
VKINSWEGRLITLKQVPITVHTAHTFSLMEALLKENVSLRSVVLNSYQISSFFTFTTFLSLGRGRKKTPRKNPYVARVYFCDCVLLKIVTHGEPSE